MNKTYSYWEQKYWFDSYDYLIVGGGFVGLYTSILLAKKYPSAKIGVIDRHQIPQGASTKNAGFACFGSVGEIMDDLEHNQEADVIDCIRLRWQGLQTMKSLIDIKAIDYRECQGTEVFLDDNEGEVCFGEIDRINSIMEKATGLRNVFAGKEENLSRSLSDKVIKNVYEGALNPVKLIKQLLSVAMNHNVNLHYGYNVEPEIKGYNISVSIDNFTFSIAFANLIYTNNAFYSSQFSTEDIVAVRNQVVVSQKMDLSRLGSCYHVDKGYIYFREIEDRLLIGGARNIDAHTETTDEFGTSDIILDYLTNFARNKLDFPDFKIDYRWSGIIARGVTSKLPLVKKIKPNIYVAIRLGGMGVATASAVATQLLTVLD